MVEQDGRMRKSFGTAPDVTEVRKAEEALRARLSHQCSC